MNSLELPAGGPTDIDQLSDVVVDDSRNPSRQPSVAPAGSSKLKTVSNAGDDDEDVDEGMDVDEDGAGKAGSEDELQADGDEDTSMTSPDKSMTPRQQQRDIDRQHQQSQRIFRKEQRQEQNSQLSHTRKDVGAKKSADSIKRFSYLLGQTELFRHFTDLKKARDPEFAKLLEESERLRDAKKTNGTKSTTRKRKSEKQEDAELLAEGAAEPSADDETFVFEESPSYVKGGMMRDYQVQGLNWMVSLYHNGINGILADEMGLGKTLQTISFLGYLKFHRNIPGLHLVVVPKSTLDNWSREFEHWVPGFRTVILRGTPDERKEICQKTLLTQEFDVLITSYEICQSEKSTLKKLSWEYIVIDEAHRIKNVNSILSQVIRLFDSRARLLITGTPLQNNLHELWALLNFLLPDVFSNVEDFDAWFGGQTGGKSMADADKEEEGKQLSEEDSKAKDTIVQQLHRVLRPFLLRRVKADVEKSLLSKKEINVYVGMTEMQRKWYRSLLEKDIDAVNGMGGKKEGKTRLLNIVMQLRKCCNHPYLFDGAEPGPPYTTDEHLVDNSGKMVVLDKLLKAMKAKGSRVLIFSQMSRVLDILEDYCQFREFNYCRIDGSTDHADRIASIDDYNKEGSDKFIFLLTTRAGGLGINLTTADIVVLYDSDWNPQADLQAMDRAHRIGQKKQVYVFRFVTENAVEEKVLERAAQKLRLDQIVIQQGRQGGQSKQAGKEDLVAMVQHGAQQITNIDEIIKRGEAKTAELSGKYANLGLDDLQNFKSDAPGTKTWEGETFGGKKKGLILVEPTKRERKANAYASSLVDRIPQKRRPLKIKLKDEVGQFQFFPERLFELQEREKDYIKKTQGYIVPLGVDKTKTAEELELERAEEQQDIDNAEPLNEEEIAEKEELQQEGFTDWHKREFQSFIRGCEKYGRDDYEAIATEVVSKDAEDVKEYSEVFWRRYKEIDDWERQVSKIEEAEAKRAKDQRLTDLVKTTVAKYSHPLQQLSITYPVQNRTKTYTEEEDRFLVCALARHGIGADDVYERIKSEVLRAPQFRFDWFFKSRTPMEIGRRCTTLISLVQKEHAPEQAASDPARKPRGKKIVKENGEGKENGDATLDGEEDDEIEEVIDQDVPAAPAAKGKKGKVAAAAMTNGKKREATTDTMSDADSAVAAAPASKKRKSVGGTGGSRSSTPRGGRKSRG